MLKVGLTGGIGSGKSTVSNIFREKYIPIVDADAISREIYNLYPQLTQRVMDEFGKEFFDENNQLIRRKLGNYIFQYPEAKKKLENIVIPFILREIFVRLDEYDKKGEPICIVDAPTLIEHGLHKDMDYNILVWVSAEIQVERVKKRDNLSDQQVINRINAQMPLKNKIDLVDFVIDNSKEIAATREQVDNVIAVLMARCNI